MSDELAEFIKETVDYIEAETGEDVPLHDVQFSIAVQGAVSYGRDDEAYHNLILLVTNPADNGITPLFVAVPQALYGDLFDTIPEEGTE